MQEAAPLSSACLSAEASGSADTAKAGKSRSVAQLARPCESGAATLCRTLSFGIVLQEAACEAPADLPRPNANWQEAVGMQRAAGSEQETSPPAQQVETTGQRLQDAFLDSNWKGEEFQRGLLNKPQQWSLEHLQTLAAEAKRNLNPNLRKTGAR